MASTDNKVCLIVIDGWGECSTVEGNAVKAAQTPFMDALASDASRATTIDAAGLAVGLPEGLMGNSEVGHLTIGSGRALYQDLVRINLAVNDREDTKKGLYNNENLNAAFKRAKDGNGRIHFMGLVSDGGVHAHILHMMAFFDAAKRAGVKDAYLHFIGDGRDTRPTSGSGYLRTALEHFKSIGYGKLADVTGRYYAMDRDKRWERVQVAYEMLTQRSGEKVADAEAALKLMEERYGKAEDGGRQTDEFLTPIIVGPDHAEGQLKEGDTMVLFNYRADRMREIAEALGVKPPFETKVVPKDVGIYCMTQYNAAFPMPQLFPPQVPSNVLAEVIGAKGVKQMHVAETEKYAHVTFFFNGGQEKQFELEERVMVPSPKEVPTYDLKPEMNAAGVADEVIKAMESGSYPFVMCNFAPPDMVGHTGQYEPAVKACEATDVAIGRIRESCAKQGFILLVTSDHGNAEQMISPQGGPHTAHTTNRVPFYMFDPQSKYTWKQTTRNTTLQDVAPTVLEMLGLPVPAEMEGQSLLNM